MSDVIEREFGWDDEIVNDGPYFVLLPEGDYQFEITGFERARHNGSEKLPPCNKAVVTVKIETAEGVASLKHNLFLHTKCEGMLCSFFTGIGHRKHGEPLKMNWNKVVGSKGKCKVIQKPWTKDNNETIMLNEIKRFYEPEEGQQQTWNAGKF